MVPLTPFAARLSGRNRLRPSGFLRLKRQRTLGFESLRDSQTKEKAPDWVLFLLAGDEGLDWVSETVSHLVVSILGFLI